MQALRAFLAVSLLLTCWIGVAWCADEPNLKLGLNHQVASGASYTLENTSGSPKASNSAQMVGNEFFLEYLVFGRVGVELATSLTPLSRNYELKSGGTTLSEVEETASLTTYGANLYFNRNTVRGLQYYLGVGGGRLTVKHDFKDGSLGDQTSNLSLPVTWVKLGLDWLLQNGGVRVQYSSLNAATTDTQEIASYKQTLTYNLGIFSIGVFAFF